MVEQLEKFLNKQTTVASKYQLVDSIEPPTLTLCFKNAFKPSMIAKYGISSTYEVERDVVNETTYNELIYILNRDYIIKVFVVTAMSVEEDWLNPQKYGLNLGLNQISNNFKFDVKSIHTFYFGLCTKITPLFEIQSFPFEFHPIIEMDQSVKVNDLPTGLFVYLTSRDNWHGIPFENWYHYKPSTLLINFKPKAYKKIVARLLPSFVQYKSGVENATECISKVIFQQSKCKRSCNPAGLTLDDHFDPCLDLKDSKCIRQILYDKLDQYKECLKPKSAMQYEAHVIYPNIYKIISNASIEISLDVFTNVLNFREETYITETHNFIGSLGGSLGMFFGFSVSSWTLYFINKLFQHT